MPVPPRELSQSRSDPVDEVGRRALGAALTDEAANAGTEVPLVGAREAVREMRVELTSCGGIQLAVEEPFDALREVAAARVTGLQRIDRRPLRSA
jgi:hypothetical protein